MDPVRLKDCTEYVPDAADPADAVDGPKSVDPQRNPANTRGFSHKGRVAQWQSVAFTRRWSRKNSQQLRGVGRRPKRLYRQRASDSASARERAS